MLAETGFDGDVADDELADLRVVREREIADDLVLVADVGGPLRVHVEDFLQQRVVEADVLLHHLVADVLIDAQPVGLVFVAFFVDEVVAVVQHQQHQLFLRFVQQVRLRGEVGVLFGLDEVGHILLLRTVRRRNTGLCLCLLLCLLLGGAALLLGLLPHEAAQVEVEVVFREVEQLGALLDVERPLDVVLHAADGFQDLVHHRGPLDGVVAGVFRQDVGLEEQEVFGLLRQVLL